MTNKFEKVPVEQDTIVLLQTETTVNGLEALYQKWLWGAVHAESLILATEDVAGLSEGDLEKKVRALPLCRPDSLMTQKRSDSGFTFVNFNFASME